MVELLVTKYIILFTFLSLGWFFVLFVTCMQYPELSLGFTEVNRPSLTAYILVF